MNPIIIGNRFDDNPNSDPSVNLNLITRLKVQNGSKESPEFKFGLA